MRNRTDFAHLCFQLQCVQYHIHLTWKISYLHNDQYIWYKVIQNNENHYFRYAWARGTLNWFIDFQHQITLLSGKDAKLVSLRCCYKIYRYLRYEIRTGLMHLYSTSHLYWLLIYLQYSERISYGLKLCPMGGRRGCVPVFFKFKYLQNEII